MIEYKIIHLDLLNYYYHPSIFSCEMFINYDYDVLKLLNTVAIATGTFN